MYSARYERTRIRDRVPTQYPFEINSYFNPIYNRLEVEIGPSERPKRKAALSAIFDMVHLTQDLDAD